MLKKFDSEAAGESQPEAYPLGYVEDDFEVRTKHGKRRVLARRGWAGEISDFFSILLDGDVSRPIIRHSRLVG